MNGLGATNMPSSPCVWCTSLNAAFIFMVGHDSRKPLPTRFSDQQMRDAEARISELERQVCAVSSFHARPSRSWHVNAS
jgi:hypothetical protein